jgi:Cu-Zn family superoxide dismutase
MDVRQMSRVGIGVFAAGIISGCEPGNGVQAIGADLPPSARIGNVASAELEPVGNGSAAGTVTFARVGEALRIDAMITGVAEGEHGLHLHETGDCSAPDASSAGEHFSPGQDPHGAPSDAPEQHHAGDLGNLTAGPDGTAQLSHDDPELTLIGEYGVVGRAVIVHRLADDLTSQPSGNAGDPIACGVIVWGPDVSPAD